MAYTLNNLINSAGRIYKLKLVAGRNGLNSVISWVHLIEDTTTTDFLRGNELIITTGFRYEGIDWLQGFISELINRNAKGMIINTGKYIEVIPKEIIDYCNQMNFPLFTMPWEIHLEDIMQHLINKIFQAEGEAITAGQLLKKALLRSTQIGEYLPMLLEMGYADKGSYTVIVIETPMMDKSEVKERIIKQIKLLITNLLSPYQFLFDILDYRQYMILIMRDFKGENMDEIGERMMQQMQHYYPGLQLRMAIGPKVWGIDQIYKSYQRCLSSIKPIYLNSLGICSYEKLGVEKLIFEIQDTDLLKHIMEDALGKLMEQDRIHETNYLDVLKMYIFNDGSIQSVAEKMFIHRNTVNYRMNKIRSIVGDEIAESKGRIKYQMAFYIYDYLLSGDQR